MTKPWVFLLCGVVVLSAVAATACGGSHKNGNDAASAPAERIKGIEETITLFKQKDPTIEQLFSKSAGYVVIPTVGEGAFIIGGGHGTGEAYEGGAYVGRVSISEVTVGAQ